MYNQDQLDELMVVLMEECGEVTQAASKCYRFGFDMYNQSRLEKEIGDLLCMVDLLKEQNLISQVSLDHQIEYKRRKLTKYSTLVEEE